jgi:superfamily I DNA and/or RNA helicase
LSVFLLYFLINKMQIFHIFANHLKTPILTPTQDHKQLKPSVSSYSLETTYHYNISLFERLISNKIPFASLSTQRRLRPCIADFTRLIYPNYTDFQNVKEYPDVRGVNENIFFFNHKQKELGELETSSKVNLFEAGFILKFVQYLVGQSY